MAREAILAAANKHRREASLRRGRIDGFVFIPKPLTARHINQAVTVCRQNLLVSDDVLVAAGFKAARRRPSAKKAAA